MNLPMKSARLALALGVSLAPALAQSHPRPQGERPGRAARDEAMSRRLKLTEAQRKAITDIRAKHADVMKAKFEASQSAHKTFQEALQNSSTTPDQLRTLHRTASDAQFEVLLSQRELRNEIHAILTPEQREQWAKMEGFRMGRAADHHRGFGARGGFGPRPDSMEDKAPADPKAH